ncbi:MAG: response regulator [Alphaproteobacteria bacterium]|nr:response regulator [Alphaproteobacteria bacterium]
MTDEKKIKVLCVEDEQDIRTNIVEILRDEGFEVFEAENGQRGFESFIANKPNIIISDILMPEVDGYGLLQLVRESRNTRNNNIPFIFLSALGQKDNVLKGVNLSANDYLVKPVDFDLMIAKIKEKTTNAARVEETHGRVIKNIKDQVTVALPTTVFSYLDVITQAASLLKSEPHGPLPHRRYLDDFELIYTNALKLRSAINNALDQSVIDYKLNAEEEILLPFNFVSELVAGLSDKLKARIGIEKPLGSEAEIKIKIDRLVLFDALKRIFSGMFKTDSESLVSVSFMQDHLDQLVIIFYLKSKKKSDLRASINESEISQILDKQACRFEIIENKDNTAILTVPDYRLVA